MSEQPSRLVRSLRKTCDLAGHAGFGLCTAVLLLLFLLQAAILVLGLIEVPNFLVQRLQEHLREEGLEIESATIRLRFPGVAVATNLTISNAETGERIAAAEVGQIRLSLLKFLRKEPALYGIAVYGGTFFCPASLSPSAKEETIAGNVHLLLERGDANWKIHALDAKIGNLAANVSGEIPVFPERPTEPVDWQTELSELLPTAVNALEILKQQTKDPAVRIRLAATEDGTLEIATEAWSEAVAVDPDVIIRRPQFSVSASYDGNVWQTEAAEFSVAQIEWDEQVTARGFRGKLAWPEEPMQWIPNRADFTVADVLSEAGGFQDLRINAAIDENLEVEADVFAFFEDGPIEGDVRLKSRLGSGDAKLRARLNPTSVLQHELARQFGLRRDLFFNETVHAVGEAVFERWNLRKAEARGHTRKAHIDGVYLDQAWAEIELADGWFRVPKLILKAEDFEVAGSYDFDIASRDYRFLFRGDLRPLHISPWFRSWWIGLWESFEFTGPPLRGDLDIRSVLGRSEEVRLVGSAAAEDFFLRGVPVKMARLKLFVLEDYADIFDLEIEREEGNAAGAFRYWADPATSDLAKVSFEIESSVDPTDVAQIFGDAGRNILSDFRFTEPPQLLMAGMFYGEPRGDETRINFSGQATAPLEYDGVPLDSLSVDGHVEGDSVILPRLSGEIAGGNFSAHAQKWSDNADDRLDFAIQVEGADITRTLDGVRHWQEAAGLGDEEATFTETGISGIFDLDLEASGLYGNFDSFTGDGTLNVREADLAEIHLLGLLSRILSATPLGFTSLQFDEAEATFEIDEEKLHVSDLRLTGTTSAISGSGDYLFSDDSLDFLIKLHFLRESRIPFLSFLLAPVLEPLAHVLEVRLMGTISDPEWRFLFGPRNILSGLSTTSNSDSEETESDSSETTNGHK